MARLKTAWDKLSMNDRALFIKLGLLHGLGGLKDIRDTYNFYADGGNLAHKYDGELIGLSLNLLLKDNTIINYHINTKEPISIKNADNYGDALDWINNWLLKRHSQLDKNERNYKRDDLIFNYDFGLMDLGLYRYLKNMESMLSTPIIIDQRYKHLYDIGNINNTYTYEDYPNIKNIMESLYSSTDKKRNIDDVKDYLNYTELGHFKPYSKHIYLAPDSNESTLIHELTHTFGYPQKILISKNKKLKENIEGDYYLDDSDEIYSRLMQFRKANNIDPEHVYTEEDLKKLEENAKDFNLLNRYTDDTILYLLNDIAKNNVTPSNTNPFEISNNTYIAAFGGPLSHKKSGKELGETSWLNNGYNSSEDWSSLMKMNTNQMLQNLLDSPFYMTDLEMLNLELSRMEEAMTQSPNSEMVSYPWINDQGEEIMKTVPVGQRGSMELGFKDPLFLTLGASKFLINGASNLFPSLYQQGVNTATKLTPYVDMISPGTDAFMNSVWNAGKVGKTLGIGLTGLESYNIATAALNYVNNPNLQTGVEAGLSLLPFAEGLRFMPSQAHNLSLIRNNASSKIDDMLYNAKANALMHGSQWVVDHGKMADRLLRINKTSKPNKLNLWKRNVRNAINNYISDTGMTSPFQSHGFNVPIYRGTDKLFLDNLDLQQAIKERRYTPLMSVADKRNYIQKLNLLADDAFNYAKTFNLYADKIQTNTNFVNSNLFKHILSNDEILMRKNFINALEMAEIQDIPYTSDMFRDLAKTYNLTDDLISQMKFKYPSLSIDDILSDIELSNLLQTQNNLTLFSPVNSIQKPKIHYLKDHTIPRIQGWVGQYDPRFNKIDVVVKNNARTLKNLNKLSHTVGHELDHAFQYAIPRVFETTMVPYTSKGLQDKYFTVNIMSPATSHVPELLEVPYVPWGSSPREWRSEMVGYGFENHLPADVNLWTTDEMKEFSNFLLQSHSSIADVTQLTRQGNFTNFDPAYTIRDMVLNGYKTGGKLNYKYSTGGPLYPFSFEKNPFLKTPVVRYDEGGHLHGFGDWLTNLFNPRDTTPTTVSAEPAPLDLGELATRQAYAESRFDSNAVSPANAIGLFLVTPNTLSYYNLKTGNTFTSQDLYDDTVNQLIRDWYMNDLMNRPWNTKNNPSDSVQYAKSLGAYNWGPTNLVDTLNKAKADGVDIYNSWDWLTYLPAETRDYINFVLRNLNNSAHRNNMMYNRTADKYLSKISAIKSNE